VRSWLRGDGRERRGEKTEGDVSVDAHLHVRNMHLYDRPNAKHRSCSSTVFAFSVKASRGE
jgi:hypothetical protein